MATAAALPTIGKTVSHFRISAKLGAGGMGVVYRASDTSLHRDIALKFLPAEAASDPAARQRLTNEARAASRLNHANIATIYDVGDAEGMAYIAMELVSGQRPPVQRNCVFFSALGCVDRGHERQALVILRIHR